MIFDRFCTRFTLIGSLLSTAICMDGYAGEPTVSEENLQFFESKVRPLLIEHCYECHSVESGESEGDLLVDSARDVLEGGASGPLLTPGKPDKSLLMRVVGYRDRHLQMPPSQKLADESIEVLRRWIEIGAPDPRESLALQEKASPLDRDPKTHWAFQLPVATPAPQSISSSSRDPIDAFATQSCDAKGIRVNAEAKSQTLIRRLYFDLTGLPPTRDQIRRFTSSDRPDAYVRLVDTLLATPEFGERFGRHWLDVARYADTVGYALAGNERRYKGSEKFRDWTIDTFASDMPYDEMLRHQLAGDRTDPNNEHGNLDAMGFLTLGRKFLNPLDTIDDRIDVISRGLLGLTVSCARCHDHKFDPIPSADYYALGGILFSSETPEDGASPLMMVDKKKPIDSPILIRGQRGNRGPIAPRQFLTALRKPNEPRFSDGSGRRELAERIVAPDNPLTARVMVNRIWGHLIGQPLIDTPSDFGYRTKPPEIPETLDNLAVDFMSHWSVKRIVRRIVLSRIYRQSSTATEATIRVDPDNVFLARANRKRRDFESLRDSILLVAANLDRSMGGAPTKITLDTPNPRRTVYAMIDRQNLPALFRTFDFASPDTHSPKRYFTTVPQQALFLLNNPQMIELARRTAQSVNRDTGGQSPGAVCDAMFAAVLGRSPSEREKHASIELLNSPLGEIQLPVDMRSMWSYGVAKIDENGRPSSFKPFKVFQDGRWQVAHEYPTKLPYGHAFLSSENGHTPSDSHLAVVRRFTAPFAGRIRLRGQAEHPSKKGDGFHASLWSGGRRLYSEQEKSNKHPFGPIDGQVGKGQTIDMVASPGESSLFDSFRWRMRLKLFRDDGSVLETESAKHFSGPYDAQPTTQPINRLAQLAQTLLMSNEFAFVD